MASFMSEPVDPPSVPDDVSRPVLDPSALQRLERIGGADLVLRMRDTFSGYAPGRLAAVESALQAGVLEEIGDGAHALKSSAGNIGAWRLRQIAETTERAARHGDVAAAAAHVEALGPALEEALRALDAAVGERHATAGGA